MYVLDRRARLRASQGQQQQARDSDDFRVQQRRSMEGQAIVRPTVMEASVGDTGQHQSGRVDGGRALLDPMQVASQRQDDKASSGMSRSESVS